MWQVPAEGFWIAYTSRNHEIFRDVSGRSRFESRIGMIDRIVEKQGPGYSGAGSADYDIRPIVTGSEMLELVNPRTGRRESYVLAHIDRGNIYRFAELLRVDKC